MKTVLTIAGSDSGGGAGIQGDLKTIEAHSCFGMSVVTAVTAQNTREILAVQEVSGKILQKQLEAVLSDIRPDAVKIGMVYSRENVELISQALRRWEHGPVVVDPVMVSTSGRLLLKSQAVEALEEQLFPLAALLTPNLPEARALLEKKPGFWKEERAGLLEGAPVGEWKDTGREDSFMEEAAHALCKRYRTSVLLKGGHREKGAYDLLCDKGQLVWFRGEQIQEAKGSHGTGCALSSAIACNLAAGMSLPEAVGEAKTYVAGALLHAPGLGQGNGPLYHGFRQMLSELAGNRGK